MKSTKVQTLDRRAYADPNTYGSGVSPHDFNGVPIFIVVIMHDKEQEFVTAISVTIDKYLLKRHLKEGISQSS